MGMQDAFLDDNSRRAAGSTEDFLLRPVEGNVRLIERQSCPPAPHRAHPSFLQPMPGTIPANKPGLSMDGRG
jgi:hypothetical protein